MQAVSILLCLKRMISSFIVCYVGWNGRMEILIFKWWVTVDLTRRYFVLERTWFSKLKKLWNFPSSLMFLNFFNTASRLQREFFYFLVQILLGSFNYALTNVMCIYLRLRQDFFLWNMTLSLRSEMVLLWFWGSSWLNILIWKGKISVFWLWGYKFVILFLDFIFIRNEWIFCIVVTKYC